MCVKKCDCNHCYKKKTCSDCEHVPDRPNCFTTGVQNCPHRVPYPYEQKSSAPEALVQDKRSSEKRMTFRDAAGRWVIACNRFWNWVEHKYPAHIRGEAVDRLAEFEELGMEPDEIRKNGQDLDAYAAAARAIALHLKPFCDDSLPYPEMIADAARKAGKTLDVYREFEQAYREAAQAGRLPASVGSSVEYLRELIRRDTPKEPERESLADRDCPHCGAGLGWDALNDPLEYAPDFCKACGQRFDWDSDPAANRF